MAKTGSCIRQLPASIGTGPSSADFAPVAAVERIPLNRQVLAHFGTLANWFITSCRIEDTTQDNRQNVYSRTTPRHRQFSRTLNALKMQFEDAH
jgi:hypothetical protein